MKFLFTLSVILAASIASAANESLTLPRNQNITNIEQNATIAPSDWRFMLGRSAFVGTQKSKRAFDGNGMSFVGEKSLVNYMSVGANYSLYNVEGKRDEVEGQRKSLSVMSAYLNAIPIQYTQGKMLFSGMAQFGIANDNLVSKSTFYPFFGAAFELGINNQIGVRIERKMSEKFEAVNTVAMVGYY